MTTSEQIPTVTNTDILDWASAQEVQSNLQIQEPFDGLSLRAMGKIVSVVRKERVDIVRTAIGVALLDRAQNTDDSLQALRLTCMADKPPEEINPVTILYDWKPTLYDYQRDNTRVFHALSTRVAETMPHLTEREHRQLSVFLWPSHSGTINKVKGPVKLHDRGMTFGDSRITVEDVAKIKGVSRKLAKNLLEFVQATTI